MPSRRRSSYKGFRTRTAVPRTAIVRRVPRQLQPDGMLGRSLLAWSPSGFTPLPRAHVPSGFVSRPYARPRAWPVRSSAPKALNRKLRAFRPIFSSLSGESVCAKRDTRTQVLFALKVAGRRWGSGGPSMQNARRSEDSNVSCKRR